MTMLKIATFNQIDKVRLTFGTVFAVAVVVNVEQITVARVDVVPFIEMTQQTVAHADARYHTLVLDEIANNVADTFLVSDSILFLAFFFLASQQFQLVMGVEVINAHAFDAGRRKSFVKRCVLLMMML